MGQLSTVPKFHNSGGNLWETQPTAVEDLEALVLRRVRMLYDTPSKDGEKWTAEKLMPFFGMKDPSGVRKLLNGDNKISVAHIQAFCEAFGLTPCELMSPPDARFAYLKEAEPALLRMYREMDEHERMSLLTVLRSRRPVIIPSRKAKLGRATLTERQQLVADLFSKSDAQSQEGVLKILRGAARKADANWLRTDTSE